AAEGGRGAARPAPGAAPRGRRGGVGGPPPAVLAVAAAFLALLPLRGGRQPARVVRSSLAPPAGGTFWLDPATPGPPAVSPDGRRIVFTAKVADARTLLYIRSLDAAEAVALPGTEGAQYPFWSPDSRSIGFFAGSKLKTIDADGGPPVTVCSTDDDAKGGTWNREGTILFARGSATTLSPLHA